MMISEVYRESSYFDRDFIDLILSDYHVVARQKPDPAAAFPMFIDYVLVNDGLYTVSYNLERELENVHNWQPIGSFQAQLDIQLSWKGYRFFSGHPLREIVDYDFFKKFRNW